MTQFNNYKLLQSPDTPTPQQELLFTKNFGKKSENFQKNHWMLPSWFLTCLKQSQTLTITENDDDNIITQQAHCFHNKKCCHNNSPANNFQQCASSERLSKTSFYIAIIYIYRINSLAFLYLGHDIFVIFN